MTNMLKTSTARRLAVAATVLALVVPSAAAASATPTHADGVVSAADSPTWPLERAHAHNDYEHTRPLLDALDHGFTSVEADVWLQFGELRVAHDSGGTTPGVTLETMYLDPLRDRIAAQGGSAYAGWGGSLQLLIDVKSNGADTYALLDRVLSFYPELTSWTDGVQTTRAVTVVVSGNQDRAAMSGQQTRYAGYDGRISDLGAGTPPSLMPLVSADWNSEFSWRGDGAMPTDQQNKLAGILTQAHNLGYRVRFWNTVDQSGPPRGAVWRAVMAANVDYINTDDLAGLESFLRSEDPQEQPTLVHRKVAA